MKHTQPLIKNRYQSLKLFQDSLVAYTHVGKDTHTKKRVLIQTYKDDYLNADLIHELIELTETLMALDHPSLFQIIDYDYDGESFYVIYSADEKVVSLHRYLDENPDLTVQELWKIVRQLLSGLRYLESHNIVHGSLDLTSIYLTPDHQVRVLRTAIPARIIKANMENFEVIEEGVFLAPEFVHRFDYDIRSDIYSFGVILYYLFSRKLPYDVYHNLKKLKESYLKHPHPFSPILPSVPDKVTQLISTCIRVNPDQRFDSFNSLALAYQQDSNDFELPEASEGRIETEIRQELEVEKKKFRRQLFLSFGILGWVLSLLLIGYQGYIRYLTAIPEIAVPELRSLSLEEGVHQLEEQKLSAEIGGYRFHPTVEAGNIIETKPPAGREVKRSRTIRVYISKGPIQLLVPDLVGRNLDQAELLLQDKSSLIEIKEEQYSDSFAKGVIIEQSPTPNTFISSSENISLVVSKGLPVDVEVTKAISFFFQSKQALRKVLVSFYLEPQWNTQDVLITSKQNGSTETIYHKEHYPGEEAVLEFELPLESTIYVYFNDDLIVEKTVQDEEELQVLESN